MEEIAKGIYSHKAYGYAVYHAMYAKNRDHTTSSIVDLIQEHPHLLEVFGYEMRFPDRKGKPGADVIFYYGTLVTPDKVEYGFDLENPRLTTEDIANKNTYKLDIPTDFDPATSDLIGFTVSGADSKYLEEYFEFFKDVVGTDKPLAYLRESFPLLADALKVAIHDDMKIDGVLPDG